MYCKEKRIYRYITKIKFLRGASEIFPCAKCYKIKFQMNGINQIIIFQTCLWFEFLQGHLLVARPDQTGGAIPVDINMFLINRHSKSA